jgi:hypothetical protein
MKLKLIFGGIAVLVIAAVAAWNVGLSSQKSKLSGTMLENVEALSSETGGNGCNGCSDIGWGTHKILECDCNYDHFSSCSRWGC